MRHQHHLHHRALRPRRSVLLRRIMMPQPRRTCRRAPTRVAAWAVVAPCRWVWRAKSTRWWPKHARALCHVHGRARPIRAARRRRRRRCQTMIEPHQPWLLLRMLTSPGPRSSSGRLHAHSRRMACRQRGTLCLLGSSARSHLDAPSTVSWVRHAGAAHAPAPYHRTTRASDLCITYFLLGARRSATRLRCHVVSDCVLTSEQREPAPTYSYTAGRSG